MAPRVFQESDFMDSAPPPAIVAPAKAPRVFQESDFVQPTQQPSLFSDPIGYVAGTSDWSVSNLIPNLTSSDWWMTRPSGEKITAGQAVAGPGMAALDTLTAGLGDETVAGGGALLDSIMGGPGYDARLQQARDTQKSFAEASPTVDTGIRLISALKGLPVGSSLKATDGIIKGTAKLAGEGAAYGGAYGFGEGEGGAAKRIDSAKQDAKSGALFTAGIGLPMLVTSKAISGIAEKAPNWARTAVNRAFGINESDFTKSARADGLKSLPNGQTTTELQQSIKALKEDGVLSGAKTAEDILKKHNKNTEILRKELRGYLNQADEALQGKKVYPKTFSNAEDYINNVALKDDVSDLMNQLEQYKKALREHGDGSITQLQQQKQKLYEKAYPEGSQAREGLDQAIAKDLKETIEEYTNVLLPKSSSGAIKKVNSRLAPYESTRRLIERQAVKSQSSDGFDQFKQFIRTSGGYGVPIYLGGSLGGLPGVALGAGIGKVDNYLRSPAGASLRAGVTEEIGKISKDISPFINKSTSAVLPNLGKGLQSFEGNNPQQGTATTRQLQLQGAVPQQGAMESQNYGNKLGNNRKKPMGLKQSVSYSYNNPASRIPQPKSEGQAVSKQNVSALINQQPPLIKAIISVESNGKHDAVSKAGAKGLMQVMPANLKKLGFNGDDPAQNIQAGVAIIQEEMQRFQDPRLALAAYNAGSPKVLAAIKRAGSRDWYSVAPYLPEETRAYVPKVLSKFKQYST